MSANLSLRLPVRAVSPQCRLLLFASAVAFVLFLSFSARSFAHPLGNFTINHYARLEIKPTEVQLYIVYDYAEIPTFQEKQTLDRNSDGTITEDERSQYLTAMVEKLKSNLTLESDGNPAGLSVVPNSSQLVFLPGQGGLEIMQIRARFRAQLDAVGSGFAIRFRDANYPERVGWREIVARAESGLTITKSNVRSTETSDELRTYPENLLSNPLNDREAELTLASGTTAVSSSASSGPIGSNFPLVVALVLGVLVVTVLAGVFLILRRKPNSPR